MKEITFSEVRTRESIHKITEIKCGATVIGWVENFESNKWEERPWTAYSPVKINGRLFVGDFWQSKCKNHTALDEAAAALIKHYDFDSVPF